MKNYRIGVIGAGYVGFSNACLLAQNHHVILLDINEERIQKIRQWQSPIHDPELQQLLNQKTLHLAATTTWDELKGDVDFYVIATPTDYDPLTDSFNTQSVDDVIHRIVSMHFDATIVIKSTLPVGYTVKKNKEHPDANIVFSPEFLREGQAFRDNLYPSRIVIGTDNENNRYLGSVWRDLSLNKDVNVVITKPTEAEAIKLFANSYLAMRVAFFNELDTYAEQYNLSSKDLIDGLGLDPRIGSHYNNPSFGYGGYCFPKDTKELLATFKDTPQKLIQAIVEANDTRKTVIADRIVKTGAKTIGIYRLIMKHGSDNYRQSAILDIIELLIKQGLHVVVFEPFIVTEDFHLPLMADLEEFKKTSELIVTNRWDDALKDVKEKVYTRDLYTRD